MWLSVNICARAVQHARLRLCHAVLTLSLFLAWPGHAHAAEDAGPDAGTDTVFQFESYTTKPDYDDAIRAICVAGTGLKDLEKRLVESGGAKRVELFASKTADRFSGGMLMYTYQSDIYDLMYGVKVTVDRRGMVTDCVPYMKVSSRPEPPTPAEQKAAEEEAERPAWDIPYIGPQIKRDEYGHPVR